MIICRMALAGAVCAGLAVCGGCRSMSVNRPSVSAAPGTAPHVAMLVHSLRCRAALGLAGGQRATFQSAAPGSVAGVSPVVGAPCPQSLSGTAHELKPRPESSLSAAPRPPARAASGATVSRPATAGELVPVARPQWATALPPFAGQRVDATEAEAPRSPGRVGVPIPPRARRRLETRSPQRLPPVEAGKTVEPPERDQRLPQAPIPA
jgi:hypothetical protein